VKHVSHAENGVDDVTAKKVNEKEGHYYASVDLDEVEDEAPPEIETLPNESEILSCFEEYP